MHPPVYRDARVRCGRRLDLGIIREPASHAAEACASKWDEHCRRFGEVCVLRLQHEFFKTLCVCAIFVFRFVCSTSPLFANISAMFLAKATRDWGKTGFYEARRLATPRMQAYMYPLIDRELSQHVVTMCINNGFYTFLSPTCCLSLRFP